MFLSCCFCFLYLSMPEDLTHLCVPAISEPSVIILFMKAANKLPELAVLLGLFASIMVGYTLGSLLHVSRSPGSEYDNFGFPTLPPLTKLNIPPQTADGITATIDGVYADPSRVVFIVRFSSNVGNLPSDRIYLADASGEQMGMIVTMVGPLLNETSSYLIDFSPDVQLNRTRLNGQLFISFASPTDSSRMVQFHFDFDMPIHETRTFYPKKTISIDGVDILLDRLVIAPATTYAYLCYPNLKNENWILTGENIDLYINRQVSNPNRPDYWLFDSTIVEGEQFGEPGWTPPNEESRCMKLGFPIGDANPVFLILTLPGLEDAMTTPIPEEKLSAAYEKLFTQGIDMTWYSEERGTFTEYKKLPEGMTEKEAYRQFLEALGYIREGPWIFRIILFP
jgi:hypothetical protein